MSKRYVVRTRHSYAFESGLVHKACGRRMQGNWVHGEPYYRCRFPQEYAHANNVDHPLNVYLRGPVDGWLAQAFAPSMIEQTSLDAAQPNNDSRLAELRRQIAECDRKLDGAAPSSKPGATPSSSQRGQGRAG